MFSFVTAITLFRILVYLKGLKQLQSLLRVLFVLKNLMTDVFICVTERGNTRMGSVTVWVSVADLEIFFGNIAMRWRM